MKPTIFVTVNEIEFHATTQGDDKDRMKVLIEQYDYIIKELNRR